MLTRHVKITSGYHRGHEISGIFPIHKDYDKGIITVVAPIMSIGNLVETPRIRVDRANIEYVSAASQISSYNHKAEQTDDNTDATTHTEQPASIERIRKVFHMIGEITSAVASGLIRGLVISGPPGIGKSHSIIESFRPAATMKEIAELPADYAMISGKSSAIGLYQVLYNFRNKGQTVIFDDCDGILSDEDALNVLKSALDSKEVRRISWLTTSRILREESIPNTFDYRGSIIFLTNVNFNRTRESKLQKHLNAIASRCHYIDVEIETRLDLYYRICQVVQDGLLDSYKFTNAEVDELLNYIRENLDHLNEVSLRTALKIADFMKHRPDNWRDFVTFTCLSKEFRIMQTNTK